MSDFFVSEILVLILLILPLIRPFSKALKTAGAIPLLPLVSFIILIFTIMGQGLIFSLIPAVLIVIICIITEFARFVMFLRQVPNNFYAIPSILLRIFLLILLGGAFYAAFYFSPEREYAVFTSVAEAEKIYFTDDSKKTAGTYYKPEPCNKENEAIIIVPPFPAEEYIGTFDRYLLNEGYKIASLSLPKSKGYKYNLKHSELFFTVLNSVLKNKEDYSEKLQEEELIKTLSKLTDFLKKTELFLIAEGPQVQPLCDYYNKNQNAFSRAFFIVSENEPLPKGLKDGSYIILNEKDLKFSEDTALFPICIFIQSKENLPGFGDLRGNDILASLLLGAERDLGRQDRIKTVKAFEKWLNLRSSLTIK
ncbi:MULTISPECIES: hypothetical protein [unclassified Treponema]|uniref:hypothetical protein n=1 Tax=unclassified Treponema TaxID=2638727 RepID=UPI0020A45ABA|nr:MULTISPECIES: hypothetical protein [unclassified Treponema]UTC67490.1 hypothetical protein E4O06_02120 [Treponema sp. OMZ 789]UTC70218.1 hypothetical protein E4O01_02110 [Treponema sp. OMZ 790]UTC72933.1 hypothetical protein E4O02_02110 [Treponema sp. OMZ 791]